MPYSDNSAFEVVAQGSPVAGSYPTVSLIPYNRLVVVVDAQGCTGNLGFEGSIDGTTWFDLALSRMGDLSRKLDFTIALGQLVKPIALSMMLQDSSTAYLRAVCLPGVTGGTLTIKARKENS